jgi:hypothetical protein
VIYVTFQVGDDITQHTLCTTPVCVIDMSPRDIACQCYTPKKRLVYKGKKSFSLDDIFSGSERSHYFVLQSCAV